MSTIYLPSVHSLVLRSNSPYSSPKDKALGLMGKSCGCEWWASRLEENICVSKSADTIINDGESSVAGSWKLLCHFIHLEAAVKERKVGVHRYYSFFSLVGDNLLVNHKTFFDSFIIDLTSIIACGSSVRRISSSGHCSLSPTYSIFMLVS